MGQVLGDALILYLPAILVDVGEVEGAFPAVAAVPVAGTNGAVTIFALHFCSF